MSRVRTRFAPSPTGFLHIGGARTALFNFLYSRHHDGIFVLRIADTDRERSTTDYLEAILDSLRWLGLAWDEGPIFQSARTTLYRERAETLLSRQLAFRCTCTAAELEAKRTAALAAGRKPMYDGTCRGRRLDAATAAPHVVRFRTPREGETAVDDLVKSRVVFNNAELDDLVILRSDGTPTYNFCAVVDDAEMAITHVIRGDDHLANTPRQILMYEAFGYPVPHFAHVPLILGTDRARLSKRHGAMSVTAYRDAGYLPEALVNYLARLGWSHGDQEIFSQSEMIAAFTVEDVGKAAGIFNPEKLLWLNAQYLKARPPAMLVDAIRPLLAARGHPATTDADWLARVVAVLQSRAHTLCELVDQVGVFVGDDVVVDAVAAGKFLTPPIAPVLDDLIAALGRVSDWTHDPIHAAFHAVLDTHGLALGKLAQPVRVALTGTTASPGIFDVVEILGRERTLDRLRRAVGRAAVAAPA